MRIIKKTIVVFSIFILLNTFLESFYIYAESLDRDANSTISYPYKTYDNSNLVDDNIIKPNLSYPANSDTIDEATISVAQMISLNDLAGSYFNYSLEQTLKQPWAGAVYSSFTLVDWRGFQSTIKNNIYDVFQTDSKIS